MLPRKPCGRTHLQDASKRFFAQSHSDLLGWGFRHWGQRKHVKSHLGVTVLRETRYQLSYSIIYHCPHFFVQFDPFQPLKGSAGYQDVSGYLIEASETPWGLGLIGLQMFHREMMKKTLRLPFNESMGGSVSFQGPLCASVFFAGAVGLSCWFGCLQNPSKLIWFQYVWKSHEKSWNACCHLWPKSKRCVSCFMMLKLPNCHHNLLLKVPWQSTLKEPAWNLPNANKGPEKYTGRNLHEAYGNTHWKKPTWNLLL